MYKLVQSEALHRKIRKDDWAELGIPTWNLVEQAIREDNGQQALECLDYLFHEEVKYIHDQYADFIYGLLTYLADNFGEEEVPKALRFMFMPMTSGTLHGRSFLYDTSYSITQEETVQQVAEGMRAHCACLGDLTMREEEDKYVIVNNPCGSGGRMRRSGRTESPYNFGATKKPYPWSWGKAGVPYYCVHCALWWGIMAIEAQGYPVRVHEFPGNPNDPCLMIFYKNPELIPEKYFTELGMEKDPSKFGGKST